MSPSLCSSHKNGSGWTQRQTTPPASSDPLLFLVHKPRVRPRTSSPVPGMVWWREVGYGRSLNRLHGEGLGLPRDGSWVGPSVTHRGGESRTAAVRSSDASTDLDLSLLGPGLLVLHLVVHVFLDLVHSGVR